MPHFPKPFYRASRDLYYVQLNGKQINLGRDKDEAYRRYHQILASETDDTVVVEPENASIAVLCDMFLEWVEKHLAPATYGWYQPRLQSFVLASRLWHLSKVPDCNFQSACTVIHPT